MANIKKHKYYQRDDGTFSYVLRIIPSGNETWVEYDAIDQKGYPDFDRDGFLSLEEFQRHHSECDGLPKTKKIQEVKSYAYYKRHNGNVSYVTNIYRNKDGHIQVSFVSFDKKGKRIYSLAHPMFLGEFKCEHTERVRPKNANH